MEIYTDLIERNPDWILMGVVGSQNYGTAIEGSDTDVKVAYLPRFENYFFNNFYHYDSSGPENSVDFTVHPIHEFMNHAFKGNMNFWEVFFAENTVINEDFIDEDFLYYCRETVMANWINNYEAMRGMAIQKNINAIKCVQSPEKFWKEAQHSIRMLDTLLDYYNCRGCISLNIVSKMNPEWKNWRSRTIVDVEEFNRVFDYTMIEVDSLRDNFLQRHISDASRMKFNRDIAFNMILNCVKSGA